MTIRAIIIDLGGVLLRTTDFSPRERLASRLGMNRQALEKLIFNGESGDRAQKGEITVHQHWENLACILGYSHNQMENLVNEFFVSDVLDLELLDYVRRLHKNYKTALLSNAWDDLRQVIAERWHFEDAFDEMIISAEVGLVKPDARIFLLALEQLGVEAGESIYVDDMQHNVESARRVGLQSIWFNTPQQMQLDLERLLDCYRG